MSVQRACSAPVTALRAAPRTRAEQVSQVLAGEPLTVVTAGAVAGAARPGDPRMAVRAAAPASGWLLVCTAYDYPGWLPSAALDAPPDPRWAAPTHDGDPVTAARELLGTPYLWGGMTGAGIDCSGLVHIAHRAVGLVVARDADQQEAVGMPVPAGCERRGDLVLYGQPLADHVAFWIGDGRILHATDRAGVHAVVEETEPAELRSQRRGVVRL